jgi:hypothetical protein
MRTARRFQSVWILLLATTLATPACYTLLKHPSVDMTVYEDTPDSRCTSCHAEGDVIGYFRPPMHPAYPVDDVVWNEPPWWWDDYWYFDPFGPSNPTALRGFRPGTGEEYDNPIIGGGPVIPPPGPKVIGGDVRVRDPDDKKGEKHDEEIRDGKGGGGGGKESNENKNKDRPVRPKGNKGKEDG